MKTHLLLCMGIFLATTLSAQSDGPHNPGTVTTSGIAGSSKTWRNINNVMSSDNAYADFNFGGGAGTYSGYLVATNFGMAVPAGMIITGILVEIERSDTKNNMSDFRIRIVKGGVIINSSDRSTSSPFQPFDQYSQFGSSVDKWGENWTVSDVNSSNFGVAISARENNSAGGSSGRIDNIRITAYYQSAMTLPLKLTSFTAAKSNNSAQLKWIASEETNMSHYELQRSVDGRNYTPIHTVASRNSALSTVYFFTDNNPGNTVAYYRLKMAGNDPNDLKYSPVVSVHFSAATSLNLWPALITAGQTINVSNPAKERLTIHFFNNSGQQVSVINTESNQFSSQSLSTQKGTVIYKVLYENGNIAGSGRLFVQ